MANGSPSGGHEQIAIASLQHQVEQKDEELRLYKGKYEESLKQVTQLVSLGVDLL